MTNRRISPAGTARIPAAQQSFQACHPTDPSAIALPAPRGEPLLANQPCSRLDSPASPITRGSRRRLIRSSVRAGIGRCGRRASAVRASSLGCRGRGRGRWGWSPTQTSGASARRRRAGAVVRIWGTRRSRGQVTEVQDPSPPKVTEYEVQAKRCGGCGAVSVGRAPAQVSGHAQYGPQTHAQAVNLLVGHHIPVHRATIC
jgi:hypothetical protein